MIINWLIGQLREISGKMWRMKPEAQDWSAATAIGWCKCSNLKILKIHGLKNQMKIVDYGDFFGI